MLFVRLTIRYVSPKCQQARDGKRDSGSRKVNAEDSGSAEARRKKSEKLSIERHASATYSARHPRSLRVPFFPHNDAPFRHNYRHYSGEESILVTPHNGPISIYTQPTRIFTLRRIPVHPRTREAYVDFDHQNRSPILASTAVLLCFARPVSGFVRPPMPLSGNTR